MNQIAKCANLDIVAVCDVDLNRMADAKRMVPNARFYQDWRVLLDKEAKNIDSVNVSTPDHMHAPIGISAMELGKHLYCQKPLAHDIFEVRRMAETAHKKRVVTQMGIQIHSDAHYKIAVKLIQDGAIGKIKEVHSWCNKSWGDMDEKPNRIDPIPESLDWNLWLGVCASRPFIGDQYYHPGNWRKRLDFGTGTFGDMGCHIFDPVFESIGLAEPITVRSEGPVPNQWNWALNGKVLYTFKGTERTDGKTLPVTWYDGTSKVSNDLVALVDDGDFPFAAGSLFVGTEGVLLLPHIDMPRLFPSAKFKDYTFPKVKGAKHWEQFINACRGEDKTTAGFSYAAPLTESVLLGCTSTFFPNTTLGWNAKKMQFNVPEANHYIRRDYRKGWEVAGI